MITHLSLIGHAGAIIADVRQAPMDAPDAGDTIALTLGAGLIVHMDIDTAEAIAESLIDAITTRDDVLSRPGPVPFLPAWVGLA